MRFAASVRQHKLSVVPHCFDANESTIALESRVQLSETFPEARRLFAKAIEKGQVSAAGIQVALNLWCNEKWSDRISVFNDD